MNNKKSTGLLLSILGVISLVLITAGVTYAFFSYTKEGLTENTISTGTITFYYDEKEAEGNGINITDALPMSDTEGMALEGDNNVFNFNITSTVAGDANIPYTVTVRKNVADSTLAEEKVKIYLATDAEGTNYTLDNGVVTTFADLDAPTGITLPDGTVEKVMFEGTVGANVANYSEDFILKMWIDGESATASDYSAYEFVATSASTGVTDALSIDTLVENGAILTSTEYYDLDDTERANYERIAYVNYTDGTIYTVSQAAVDGFTAGNNFAANEQYYPLNSQTFKVTVNVYANAVVVSDGTGTDTTE